MKFYNRKGVLYVRLNGKRISTKLKDNSNNRKLVKSYYKNDEFFEKFNLNVKVVPTLCELCIEVLRDKERILKTSTMLTYYSLYDNYIYSYFKDAKVTNIKPLDINSFYSKFQDRSSLNTCNSILRASFEKAILNEYIETTPLVISKPRFKSDYESNPFTLDEVKIILLNATSDFKNLLGVAFFTGLRVGELVSLQWKDISFDNDTIDVNKTMVKGILQTPKTKSSKAIIDLPIEALPYFKSQRLLTGLKTNVFYSPRGMVIKNITTVAFRFNKLLTSLNLKNRGIHQIRHTFASLKLSYGERLEWVSFMLRHENPRITQEFYYKYLPRKKEKRVILDIGIDTEMPQSFA